MAADEPDYVVVRPHPDLPAGFLPPDLDGRWFDRSALRLGSGTAVAVPSGRFEVRDDGAVAEVYEVRP
ncbi:hypothetical protein C1I95_17595 [Micromonospora craterilacus]|uniref:Uncharacterized protein n=1 Tax=Micromonospora craterilacus TaxID=1655439 RepID=A0A2W2DX58_9ACTN|nr:hypothetical protein [Micromonospora craterilacus]PZG16486.1 hypothetical protein C1I95_17595 [Micromonospora craterilacus]